MSAVDRGVRHLLDQQRQDGCWEGEMVWCTMILSQHVIVRTVTGHSFDEHTRSQIIKHYRATRTPEGVWGLHRESGGYVFVTTLAYVALRLMGVGSEDPLLSVARHWLRARQGGVLAIPGWGKFWLAMLGLYGYEGVNPIPPEILLLPRWLPFHPHRFYCHTRLIYLAMAYLYGSRYRAELGPLVSELREELYAEPFSVINFAAHRHEVAPSDLYVRPSRWLRVAYDAFRFYERFHIPALRRRALTRCLRLIVAEQRATQYQALSPVNGVLNCLALWTRSPNQDLRPSLQGLEKWKWEDESDGIRYAGARSQTWDTALAMQALLSSPAIAGRSADVLRRAYIFVRDAQLTAEVADYQAQGRDPTLGGWCFSDGMHRWPVSDCTAEALVALLKLHHVDGVLLPAERISEERIRLATRFLLSRQNADGGFGTYERRRGSSWLEAVNPSEMFGQCMTEMSYVECTASALSALAHVRDAYPTSAGPHIDHAMARSVRFLRSRQRADGSFAGFWGINFTYAIFHVIKGLRAAGISPDDPAIVRAAAWLVARQRADGGWGEHYSSCLEGRYVEHSEGQVVMTSWALLALMDAMPVDAPSIAGGIAFLSARQGADGSWPREAVNGVFFGSAMLDYRLYTTYFPVWALARHAALRSHVAAKGG